MDEQPTTKPKQLLCLNVTCRLPLASIVEDGAALQLDGGGRLRHKATICCSSCETPRPWFPPRPKRAAKRAA